MPTLRGSSPFVPAPPTYTRWAGFYFGGQIGQSSAEMNFAGATKDLVGYLLRNSALEQERHPSEWAALGKDNPSGLSYGGFVGYNVQFSDVIFGLELHYNRSGFSASAPVSPISRVVAAGGLTYAVTVDGAATMDITDYGSARIRAGWIPFENVLAYGAFGLALGRANITRTANVYGLQSPADPCGPPAVNNCVPFSFSASESSSGAFLYGWSIAGGADFFIMPNVFVRGEVEYISFTKAQGILAQIGTARVGAGVKF